MRNPRNEALKPDIAGSRPARESEPERRCVLTGKTGSRERLLRLALSPDGDVLPDALAKAPGRGAWIGVNGKQLAEARISGALKGALSRAFKTSQIAIPDNLEELCRSALFRAFTDRLGLEMRAGFLILGSEKIAAAARAGDVTWLGHAADASEDGRKKLDQAWRVGCDAEGTGKAGETLPLDRAALSVALGRENVVHLALIDDAAANRLAIPLRRLARFEGVAEAAEDDPGAGTKDDTQRTSAAVNDV